MHLLKFRQFLSLLEEGESEYGELNYHTDIMGLCQWVCFENIYRLFESKQIIFGKEGQKYWGIELWRVDIRCSVFGVCNSSFELQGNDKLIAENYDNIKALKKQASTVGKPTKLT